jgi:hypothetical protein
MPFVLPSNWYRTTIERLVDEGLPPLLGDLTRQNAWKYVYACVLWAEPIGGTPYLHLNDRLSTQGGKELALRGEEYLKANLFNDPALDVKEGIDRIGKAYAAERVSQGLSATGWQRNNVTGGSFEATLQVLIHRLNAVMPSRSPNLRTLRGFELAPKGYHSRPDLALFSAADFRLLISTKWTMRKERLGTFLHEAYFYRQRRADLQVAFVVSEFNLNILEYLVGDPLVDRVYHVHLPMLLAAHQPFRTTDPTAGITRADLLGEGNSDIRSYRRWLGVREKLFDLSQLFADVDTLKGEPPEATVDPDTADEEGDGDE